MRTLIIFIFLGIAATGYAKILLTEKTIIMRNSNVEIQFNDDRRETITSVSINTYYLNILVISYM